MQLTGAAMESSIPVKGGKIRTTNMERLVLSLPDNTGEEVRCAFNALVQPESPLQQITAVEKLSNLAILEEHAEICITILTSALLQLNPKVQLRNKIFKTLPTIGCKQPELYKTTVSRVIMAALMDPKTSESVVFGVSLLVENNAALLLSGKCKERKDEAHESDTISEETENVITPDHHPLIFGALLKGISRLWKEDFLMTTSTAEISIVLQQLQQLVKNSTMYCHQHFCGVNDKNIPQELYMLKKSVLEVIQHPSCPLDLRTNCGQLVASLTKITCKGNIHQVFCSFVFDEGRPVSTPLSELALLNGVLSISQGRELYVMQEKGTCLGTDILEAVLKPAMLSNDGSIAVSVIRVVHQWTLRTLEAFHFASGFEDMKVVLDPSSPLMVRLMDYMGLAWDHFLDSVKNATKDSFVNYMKIQQKVSPDISRKYFLGVCESMLVDLCSRKFKLSAVSCMVPVVGTQNLLRSHPHLPSMLLNQLKDPALASHSAELLEALFTQHQKEVSLDQWKNLWLTVFLDLFSKDMQTYGYELLFKKLLFTCPEALSTAVERLVELSKNPVSEKLCLLIMCVKIGKASPQWQKKCQQNDLGNRDVWKSILPYDTIKLCLWHVDDSVRTAAFSLLCESTKTTELPEKEELALVYDYYLHNVTNQSPSYRQHLLKSTKKLFLRIKEGIMAISKSGKNKGSQDHVTEIISQLKEFCYKLFRQMVQNLNNGANNMRRTLSLQILELFQTILCNSRDLGLSELYKSRIYTDTLVNVLDDSYESNKVIALTLLYNIPGDCNETEKIQSLIKAASSLASVCRPPDTVTAGYLFKYLSLYPLTISIMRDKLKDAEIYTHPKELCSRFVIQLLQKEIVVAEESLLKAASSGPMYGLLLCIRMLISDVPEKDITANPQVWQDIIKVVLQLCYQVSELVAPVVRNSSPEGHLPMDLNPESLEVLRATLQQSLGNHHNERDVVLSAEATPQELVKAQAVSAQMLLLCAWRCIKEISLILGDVLHKMPLSPEEATILTIEDVGQIGQYFITQLLETKHRGAFEQSYVGFGRVCERLWSCKEEVLRKLPAAWLEKLLDTIQDDKDTQLCATRRSAGVPFIVQAVLSSEPKMMGCFCLKNTMNILLMLAEEPRYNGSEARIHSFNVLRAVYKDTRLGDFIIPYVSRGVKAAIDGYRGNSWAERNSAALLFAALVTRMLGVKRTQDDLSRKNAMSAQVFFKRYPDLYDFIKIELENGAVGVKEGKLVPALFPVLLLLARLAPAPLEGRMSAISLASFTPSVLQCAASSVLQLRALASHAIIPLVNPNQFSGTVEQIASNVSLTNQNDLHGSLLCLLKLVKSFEETICNPAENQFILKSLVSVMWSATNLNPCLVTRSCALELYSFLAQKNLLQESDVEVHKVISDAVVLLKTDDPLFSSVPWGALCQKEAARFILCTIEELKKDYGISWGFLISHSCYEVRLTAMKHMEKVVDIEGPIIMQLLNQIQVESHPECLSLLYSILCNQGGNCKFQKVTSTDQLMKLLGNIIADIKEEASLDLQNKRIKFGYVIMTTLLSMEPHIQLEDTISKWLEMMASFSLSENDGDSRQIVAEAMCNILPFLDSHPYITDKIKLATYEIIATELQDDSDSVRDVVSYGISMMLKAKHCEVQQFYLQPSRAMEKVFELIASCSWTDSASLLMKLSLKEDFPEGFGLTQEDDRVFDKGEMNTYSEMLTVTQAAVMALSDAITSHSTAPTFLKGSVVPYLSSTTFQDALPVDLQQVVSQSEGSLLTVKDLLYLLKYDILYIYKQISSLCDTALFCLRHIDLWLIRLKSRSALWAALKPLAAIQDDDLKLVVDGLNHSVLKTTLIHQIIEELSTA